MNINITKLKKIYFLLILLLTTGCNKKIKVACVGDSITFGYGIADRTYNSYPSQLQRMLGGEFEVKNFGVSGATLLKKGDLPYWNTEAYRDALSYRPDVVYIKLGSNDSKAINRKHYHHFVSDYKENWYGLFKHYRSSP